MLTDDDERVDAFMERAVGSVEPTVDREEVARQFERYDHVSLPVVDAHQRVMGVITIDDVIDIIEAEQTEDALKQVGAGAGEAVYSGIGAKLRSRFPWLAVNLGLASIGASVILLFEDMLRELTLVAVLYPVIANQSGNAGQQSLAITLRGLVLGKIHPDQVRGLLVRELAFGCATGVGIGAIFAGAIALLGMAGDILGMTFLAGFDWRLGLIAGISMAGALDVGCFIGAATPLVMHRLRVDPATSSAIFVTMFTDALSYATFLGLVFITRGWLMG